MEKDEKILLSTLLGFSFILGLFQLVSNDVWWHLKSAEWMFENLSFPYADPFTFTSHGAKWVYHNWLFDIPLLGVESLFGVGGMVVFRAVLITVLALVIYRLLRLRLTPGRAAVLTLAIIVGIRVRFFLRPALVSFILFALVIYFLYVLYEKENPRKNLRDLYAVPLLILLWANLHAGVIFGLILVGGFTVSAIIQKRNAKHFLTLAGLAVVAGLVNPNLWDIYIYPFKYMLFKQNIGFENAEHMVPPLPWYMLSLSLYWGVFLLLTVFFLLRAYKAPPYLWIFFLGFGYLALTSFRGIGFYIIFIGFAAAHLWGTVGREEEPAKDRIEMPKENPLAESMLLLCVLLIGGFITQPFMFGLGLDPTRQPVSAADFIEKNDPKGNMFNSHPFGGYLLYRFYPERQVFIDGRDLVHWDTFRRFKDLGYQSMLRSYNVDWMVVGYKDAVLKTLPQEEWGIVFYDDLAVVLVRRNGAARELLENLEYRHVNPFNVKEKFKSSKGEGRREIIKELERVVSESDQAWGMQVWLDKFKEAEAGGY